ncbi:oligosaccharide flippase family protein [Oceanobacillus sp. FSL W7-1293]|uniref:lipopolysaccharide biosynthesis protein n=1 Tax=Oceanobacillus sp. FSL W7-1293 TaxID=2921699 RepID=UPI0030D46FB2
MRNKFLLLKENSFVRNVLILSTGTAMAQIISMGLSPFITRLYGPELYGLMGTFIAIVNMISPIAALTLPIAIVLPKSDKVAIGIIKLSLVTTIAISVVISIVLLLFTDLIIDTFNLQEISSFLYYIPLVLFLAGCLQIIEQWMIRKKQFKINAKATLLQSLIINGGKVGVGYFYPFASVLILFSAITQGLKAFLMFLLSRSTRNLKNKLTYKGSLKWLFKSYKDFPLYRAPQTLINSISEGLPILMLASFFGPATVGFYNIGRTVLNMPTQLIGKSIGDVFYPNITEVANNKGNVSRILIKATFILFSIGVVPFGIILLFGPFLFGFVFGGDWVTAGEYARWIGLWSFTSLILQPSVRSLPVLKAQRFHLLFTIISLFIRLTLLTVAYYFFHKDTITVAVFGISSSLLNIILIFITILLSKKINNK